MIQGTIIGAVKGDTRSLDYSPYSPCYRVDFAVGYSI